MQINLAPLHQPYAVRIFSLHNSRYRLHIFTEYRRVLPRHPIPGRAKNGVFCSLPEPATPRAGETITQCIILGPDITRTTNFRSRKQQNLTQTLAGDIRRRPLTIANHMQPARVAEYSKKCTAHPMGPVVAWQKTGPQHPPDAFPRGSRLV